MGNQILLLNDKQVEDGDTLASFDITSSATFILLRRAPLLSGAINREELEHLLQACSNAHNCCTHAQSHGRLSIPWLTLGQPRSSAGHRCLQQ